MPGLMQVLNSAHTGLWSDETMLGTESYDMHSTIALCKKLVKLLSRRKPKGFDLYLYRIRSVYAGALCLLDVSNFCVPVKRQ